MLFFCLFGCSQVWHESVLKKVQFPPHKKRWIDCTRLSALPPHGISASSCRIWPLARGPEGDHDTTELQALEPMTTRKYPSLMSPLKHFLRSCNPIGKKIMDKDKVLFDFRIRFDPCRPARRLALVSVDVASLGLILRPRRQTACFRGHAICCTLACPDSCLLFRHAVVKRPV